MTIERAVAVLNEYHHRGFDGWHVQVDPAIDGGTYAGCGMWKLTGFEAIAVAERYLALVK